MHTRFANAIPGQRCYLRRVSEKSASSPAFVLEVESITKSYAAPHGGEPLEVVKGVSFALSARESIAIVGPSGSGKTTVLGLCAGLDRTTSGTIRLAGVSLDGLNEDARARLRNEATGFVFQSFHLVPTLTALENVLVPAELLAIAHHDRRAKLRAQRKAAEELLGAVGLRERFDHYPAQLSGGEQQRVALARAFINRPRVLFADEPTGNLDEETAERVVSLLFELNREAGTALVLVTHNLALAARADRILRMRDGRVVD